MVTFLISAAFSGAELIRVRRLLEGGAYSDLSVSVEGLNRGRRLFEALRLLEEIW